MWQVTEKRSILASWVLWHYYEAPVLIFNRWKDFMRFNIGYFSIPFLFKTLFAPWKKYKFSYGRGFNFGRYMESFVFNTFSRLIGFLFRIGIIVIGLLSQVLVFLTGLFLLSAWFLLPLLIIIGLIVSILL